MPARKSAAPARTPRPLLGRVRAGADPLTGLTAMALGLLTVGATTLRHAGGAETDAFARLATALGGVFRRESDTWHLHGTGVGGLLSPQAPLETGAGLATTALTAALIASHGLTATLDDGGALPDTALPLLRALMGRGAEIVSGAADGHLPVTIRGTATPAPGDITKDVPAPQSLAVTMLLIAGLNAPGLTRIRDIAVPGNTAWLLERFGAPLHPADEPLCAALDGQPELLAGDLSLPAAPQAVAQVVTLALALPGSRIALDGVAYRADMAAFIEALRAAGGRIDIGAGNDGLSTLEVTAGAQAPVVTDARSVAAAGDLAAYLTAGAASRPFSAGTVAVLDALGDDEPHLTGETP